MWTRTFEVSEERLLRGRPTDGKPICHGSATIWHVLPRSATAFVPYARAACWDQRGNLAEFRISQG